MNTNTESLTTKSTSNQAPAQCKPKTIKLGIDVHKAKYVVVRIIDGGAPQPAQQFSPNQFLLWVAKQKTMAEQVYSCYEAGPFGYGLHRKLEKMGITNYVIRPRDWDEYCQKVKTDGRDGQQMALNLDRYVAGNKAALCVIQVPTIEQEQTRSRGRLRESLKKEHKRLMAQGRSYGLYYGETVPSKWSSAKYWKQISASLSEQLVKLLEPLRKIMQTVETELEKCTKELKSAAAQQQLPHGFGPLTSQLLDREICDWHRFKNRRQIASYSGLCPSEDSSGNRRHQGAINKHGNGRIRPLLIECAWRLCNYQPDYRGVKKWRAELINPKTTRARRKKIVVAIARGLLVDWWRIKTGRCRPQDVGLEFKESKPASQQPTKPQQ